MMQAHDHATNADPKSDADGRKAPPWRGKWVFGGFAAIALLMLAVEHRAHLLGWLPWLFLIACPLMHVFMHGGHGGHGGKGDGGQK